MRQWWAKIRALCTVRRELSSELREELEAHLEMEIAENRERGMPDEQADRLARKRFGNATLIQEKARESWRFTAVENLAKDVRYAMRTLRKSPGYAITAVLTLALGIGGTTAMYSVIRTVLLKPLDYPDPDQLVRIQVNGDPLGPYPLGPFNWRLYRRFQATSGFSGFGAASGIPESVTISSPSGEPVSAAEAPVSANFLEILGVKPLLGRGFLPVEDQPGGPNAVLLSYGLWERLFAGNPKIVGSTISLEARPYTVIGVLPPHFEYPHPGDDLWVTRPWEWSEVAPQFWETAPILSGLARLRPGASVDEATAQLDVIARHEDPHMTMHVERLRDNIVRNLRASLWMLFGAVGFVLLIVCANISGLLLARSAGRSREFAVRSALGAARRRLIQQTLAESVLLASIGAALGVLLAHGLLSTMMRIAPIDVARGDEIHVDGAVLVFTAAVSLGTGLIFGWLPSWRFSRPDMAGFLREQGAAAGRASGGRRVSGFSARGFLVVAQVALSMVLLVGASLMLESFVRLRSVQTGIQPARLLTMEIALPPARYDTGRKKQEFWDGLVKRAQNLPGVVDAAVARSIPLTDHDLMMVGVAGRTRNRVDERSLVNLQSVSPGYFRTFGIPLIRGREFTEQDRDGAPMVGMINESFARRFWPSYPSGRSPVGQHLLTGAREKSLEIIGIVGDVHEDALASEAKPELYFSMAQLPLQTAYLAVKTAGLSTNVARLARAQVAAIDPDQSVSHVQSMAQVLNESLGSRRLMLILLASFAIVAVIVALMGVYGVMAYLVVERRQEFGIRQALGAQRIDILKLVVGRGLRLVLTGLGIGLAGSLAVARLMQGMLFHVSATDPWTFGGTALLFLAVGLAASYLPARRGTRADPAAALR